MIIINFTDFFGIREIFSPEMLTMENIGEVH